MRALDLFSGAGGASVGLHRAGFDVTGVDIKPMPEYPRKPGFTFIQADALTFPLDGFDFVWASPKCQRWSQATRQSGNPDEHPDQLGPIRERLRATGVPYIIENVLNAPLIDPIMLCGAMFGLGVIRHRLFECSFPVLAPPSPEAQRISRDRRIRHRHRERGRAIVDLQKARGYGFAQIYA